MNALQRHQERKETILELLQQSIEYYTSIEEHETAKNLQDQQESLRNNEFSIVVIGEFSAGKSTFLNALMGERYLPSFSSEATATINYLQHVSAAETDQHLKVVYKDPQLPVEYGDVTKEEIERFVSTKSDKHVASEIDHVTLYLDSPFLEQGVRLVDSPGLNGIAEGHAEVTENQVEKSHACIYMFSANRPGSRTDFDTLAQLNEKFDTIFLILNQADRINPTEETVEEVIDKLKANYAKQFPNQSLPIFYPLSSYQALVARSDEPLEYPEHSGKTEHTAAEREQLLQQSRVPAFEQRLMKFLAEGEKTRAELLTPVKQTTFLLQQRKDLLSQTLTQLNNVEALEDLERDQRKLEKELKEIEENVSGQRRAVRSKVKAMTRNARNEVTAETERLLKKYERLVNELDSLNDVEYEMERFPNRISRDYMRMFRRLDDSFREQFEEQIQETYEDIADDLEWTNDSSATQLKVESFDLSSLATVDFEAYEQESKRYEQQIEELEKEIDEGGMKEVIILSKRRQIKQLQEDRQVLEQRLQIEQSILGERPEELQIETTRKAGYFEHGIAGALKMLFTGRPDVVERKTDRTQIEKFDKERQTLMKDSFEQMGEKDREIRAAHAILTEAEMEQERLAYLERKKEKLERQKEANYEKHLQQFQQQEATQLRKIKRDMEDYMEELEEDIQGQLQQYLKNRERSLVEVIQSKVEQQLVRQLDAKRQQLQELIQLIQSSEAEKAKEKVRAERELEVVEQLMQQSEAIYNELQSMNIDTIEREEVGGY